MIKVKSYRPNPSFGESHGPSGHETKSKSHIPATKKRRKTKEPDEQHDTPSFSPNLDPCRMEDHRYERAPRLLPEISGVHSLSTNEITCDLNAIHSILPPTVDPSTRWIHSSKPVSKLTSKHVTPEEIMETLPMCRRAVRITQRELLALKRERNEMEQQYMRLRCLFLWQMEEMQRFHQQETSVLRQLQLRMRKKAKTFASSRRRSNALQDFMKEVEERGETIVRLTRRLGQLTRVLKHHKLPLPEEDNVYLGDRVKCVFGIGNVEAMDEEKGILTIGLEEEEERGGGKKAYVQEEAIEEVYGRMETEYTQVEKNMKQTFMKMMERVVIPSNGKEDEMEMEEEEGEEEEDDEEEEDEEEEAPRKKRKLHPPKKPKKKTMFTACSIPPTPYNVNLCVSPLSIVPDQVVAMDAPRNMMSTYLPKEMKAWEQDKMKALEYQGEVERLRYQVQRLEEEKMEAQQQSIDQVKSMNQLVQQVDKLREQLTSKEMETTKGKQSQSKSVENELETRDKGTHEQEERVQEEEDGGETSDSSSRSRSLRPRRQKVRKSTQS